MHVAMLGRGTIGATLARRLSQTGHDVVVLAIAFLLHDQLPAAAFGGKTAVDAANSDPGRDGYVGALDDDGTTSSELVARSLPGARVVKAFDTMVWTQLGGDGRRYGVPLTLAQATGAS